MTNPPPPPPPSSPFHAPGYPPPPPKPPGFKDSLLTWAKKHPVWAGIAAVLIVLTLIGLAVPAEDTNEDAKAADSSTNVEPSKAPASSTPSKEPSAAPSTSKPAKPKTPLEALKAKLKKTDVKVKTVEIDPDGVALVEFKVQDNFTKGMIRTGIANDVFAIAEAAHKSKVRIKELQMRGLAPLTDEYGQTEEGQAFFTTFAGSTLARINYDEITIKTFDNLENLAIDGIVVLLPDLRK